MATNTAIRLTLSSVLASGLISLSVLAASLAVPLANEAVPAPESRPTVVRTNPQQRTLPFTRQDRGNVVDEFTAHMDGEVVSGPSPTWNPLTSHVPGEQAPGEDTLVLNQPTIVPAVAVKKVALPRGALLSMPVQGSITSNFGMRFHPVLHVYKLHTGTDFGVACGTPVGAAAPGVVVSAGWAGGYGVQVAIDHGTLAGHQVRTTYNHLSAIGVRVGQKVDTGDGVGLSGTTGLSTGCHLHFEVIVDGSFTDPVPWLNGRPVIVDITDMLPIPLGGASPSPTSSTSPSATPCPTPTATPSLSPGPSSTASTCAPPTSAAPPTSPAPASSQVPSTTLSPSPAPSTESTLTPTSPPPFTPTTSNPPTTSAPSSTPPATTTDPVTTPPPSTAPDPTSTVTPTSTLTGTPTGTASLTGTPTGTASLTGTPTGTASLLPSGMTATSETPASTTPSASTAPPATTLTPASAGITAA